MEPIGFEVVRPFYLDTLKDSPECLPCIQLNSSKTLRECAMQN
jgi:hypothetical protein